MGSASSKAAGKAAGAAARKYPSRSPLASAATNTPAPPPNATTTNATPQPPAPSASQQPGPTVRPAPSASGSRDAAINLDASDPDFAQSLRNLGPVQPNPTLSPTSTFNPSSQGPDPRQNPAVLVLSARADLANRADAEIAETGRRGRDNLREFLDVYTIRQILTFREQGRTSAEIEKHLSLKKGVVARLGADGVFGLIQESGRAEREVRMV